jgi:hypothetical protein
VPQQDIPLEASEVLRFTPASLSEIEGAPVFILRAPTSRDKRFHRRLYAEEGLTQHSTEAIRAEVLAGLKALWTEEQFEEHAPVLTGYWEASDDYAKLKDDDPEIDWSYDPEIEKSCHDLVARVLESWPPLRRMAADNAEFQGMGETLMAAVVVKEWTGIDVKRQLDRGYITIATAEALKEELEAVERRNELPAGTAWLELSVKALQRMYLTEEEAINFGSPAPSETTPEASSAKSTTERGGKSPAQARSKKTRATA